MQKISYRRHRFHPNIIGQAVWLYFRFTMSFRDVEGPLAERGIDVSYETVRLWVLKFGQANARRISKRRNKRAAAKFMRKLLRNQGLRPTRIVTDKLKSYGAAFRSLRLSHIHETGHRMNNRAENSHVPIRRRERKMQRFKSQKSAQRFLSTHGAIYNLFNVRRYLISRRTLRIFRNQTMAEWQVVTAAV